MRLAHLHLPNIVPFTHASHLQQALVSRLLAHKKLSEAASSTPLAPRPPPDPTILTFTPKPVYATGRRDHPTDPSTTHSEKGELILPTPLEPIRPLLTADPPVAEYHPTLRGGQTTYHGPGQLVAYTILDLRRLNITPRSHVRLLESCAIDVLKGYGVKGTTTEDPGVWVEHERIKGREGETSISQPRKIAAVGVHLRRFISSYGIGLNVTEEPMWFFRQIVACGLEGREATSLQGEGVDVSGVGMGDVADAFVKAFVNRVNKGVCGTVNEGLPVIEEVYRIGEGDVLGVD